MKTTVKVEINEKGALDMILTEQVSITGVRRVEVTTLQSSRLASDSPAPLTRLGRAQFPVF